MSLAVNPVTVAAADHLQRIRRISRWMAMACLGLIGVLPLALIYYWATTGASELAVQGNLQGTAVQANLQAWQRWAAGAVSAVPLAMLLMGVWQARCCFAQFAQGRVFTRGGHGLSASLLGLGGCCRFGSYCGGRCCVRSADTAQPARHASVVGGHQFQPCVHPIFCRTDLAHGRHHRSGPDTG